eukprot:TRINITY_DN24572_c0_g1_i1.p1 TRINITY_DN24572_c0_g1~~TRINITY_DN24572_c0_g1_i1.p1  ORF type:complete len:238 (-),score=38.09 TRINITY_DN24572_c0_g1_i1:160-873(-)
MAVQTRALVPPALPGPSSFLGPQIMEASRTEASDSGSSDVWFEGDEGRVDEVVEPPAVEVVFQSATRTRTLGPGDLPEPSSFLGPQEIEAYTRWFLFATRNLPDGLDSDSSEGSVDGEEERDSDNDYAQNAIRTHTFGPADIPEPSAFLSVEKVERYRRMFLDDYNHWREAPECDSVEDSFDGDEECLNGEAANRGATQMQTLVPLENNRLVLRLGFPSPTEYLTDAELRNLMKSLQ